MTSMTPACIRDWHAHVYFDAASRESAWTLREAIGARLAGRVEIGRFHERPVGPHPMWSFQLRVQSDDIAHVLAWLVLHHGMLDVFVHPNTGDGLRDHRDHALWIGKSHVLDLALFGAKG